MLRSKTCFKCKLEKALQEFYAHSAMRDGYLGKCKECTKKDVREHRLSNLEKIREYDRRRGKLPERIALNVSVTRAWRAEDKRRSAAHQAVSRAILKGAISKECCARCGSSKSVAHHESYDRKLDVVWLCMPCHKERHKEMAMNGIAP